MPGDGYAGRALEMQFSLMMSETRKARHRKRCAVASLRGQLSSAELRFPSVSSPLRSPAGSAPAEASQVLQSALLGGQRCSFSSKLLSPSKESLHTQRCLQTISRKNGGKWGCSLGVLTGKNRNFISLAQLGTKMMIFKTKPSPSCFLI